jgi:hypothetical protein
MDVTSTFWPFVLSAAVCCRNGDEVLALPQFEVFRDAVQHHLPEEDLLLTVDAQTVTFTDVNDLFRRLPDMLVDARSRVAVLHCRRIILEHLEAEEMAEVFQTLEVATSEDDPP